MKEEIRAEKLKQRAMLSESENQNNSDRVFKNLLSLPEFKTAETVFCYVNFKNEIKTDKIIDFFGFDKVFLPLVRGEEMLAVKPCGKGRTKNLFGIDEPSEFTVREEDTSVTIVPLVACDKRGNRIGFGKGYYDRYLSGRNTLKIGVCHSFQVVDAVVPDEKDVILDYIVTEKEIIKVK